jgi:hypothetical protein
MDQRDELIYMIRSTFVWAHNADCILYSDLHLVHTAQPSTSSGFPTLLRS